MDKFLFLTKLSSAFYMFVHILILDAHFSLGFWDTTVYWFASCPSVCFFSVSFVSSSSSSFRSINVSEPQGSSHFTLILSLFCNLFQTCGFNNTYKLSILFPDQVFLKIWADSLWIWWPATKRWKGRCDSGRVNYICSIRPLFISNSPVSSLLHLSTPFWTSLRIQFRTFAKAIPFHIMFSVLYHH